MIVELYEIPVQAALTAVKSRRRRGDHGIAVYDTVSARVLLLLVRLEYHLLIGPVASMPQDATPGVRFAGRRALSVRPQRKKNNVVSE
jgi:hypothetical protein